MVKMNIEMFHICPTIFTEKRIRIRRYREFESKKVM